MQCRKRGGKYWGLELAARRSVVRQKMKREKNNALGMEEEAFELDAEDIRLFPKYIF